MTTLILADEVIVAAIESEVSETEGSYVSIDGVFPFQAGVTGKIEVGSLPGDFAPHKYVWRNNQVEKLPDPDPQPMTVDQAKAELAQLDAQFDPRWFEDLVAGLDPHERYAEWSARREELREIIRNG